MSRKSLAITYLSPELLADADFRARFGDECAKLTRVRDARVARVRRYVESDHDAAVISDDIRGTTLRSLLLAQGAVGTDAALVVLTDLVLALAACHRAGVTHGDVKPERVVLTPTGQVRLVDAGLWGSAGRRQLARSTPFYLAPEQWNGPEVGRTGGDVYAATATFFECLVGAPPFYSSDAAELSAKHRGGELPLEVVPEPVRELVVRGLAKDPRGRADARDFAAFVGALASRAVGSGWERRGRQELAALLSEPDQRRARIGEPKYHRPVRLAAVMGGALALAAGLSSPPLAVIPSIGIFGSGAKPPVLAFPEPDRGTAAVRVVTNRPLSERGPAPTAKVKNAGSVARAPLPASSIPESTSDTAPSEHAVPDGRYPDPARPEGAAGPRLMPPACTQRLTDDHKPCIVMNPERPTSGPAGAPSDSSEVSFPVSSPIQLPALTHQLVSLPAPMRPSWSKDVHVPRPTGGSTPDYRSEDTGRSTERLTGWSQRGFTPARGAANPADR